MVQFFVSDLRGLLSSDFSGGNQRPRRGRSAGVHFEWPKWTKSHLGRSPLRTSLGYEAVPASSLNSARHPCCGPCLFHHTRRPWAAGPMAGRFPPPGLPWRSGVSAAGGFCRTSCVAVVGVVACPARGCPGLALGDSGGASTQQPKKCGNVPGHFRPKAPLCKGSCLPVGQTEGLTLPRWQTIPPTRRCGLCIPRLAPERRGKSRSRRCTSSPHQTRLRWALAGAPSCRATSLYTREALRLAVTGSQSPARWKQRLPG